MSTSGRGGQITLPSHPRGGGQGGGRGGSSHGGGPQRSVAGLPAIFSHGPGDAAILDVKNRDLENEIEKTVLKPSASGPRLPVRPGFGTQGYRILLYANYMLLDWGNATFYRYALDFAVQGTPGRQIRKKDKQRLVTLLIEEHFAQNRSGIVTDFTSLIISNTQLNQQSYDVVYRREGEDTPVATARRYRIRLVPDGANTASELLTYLISTNPNEVCTSKDRTIQALNIIMGHNPRSSSRVASIGSNKHYPRRPLEADRSSLGAGLTVIRGFFVSVRPATGRILVNVQVKCSPFYNHGPLVNLIQDFRASRDPKKQELHRFLKGLTVHTTHTSPRKNGQPIPLPRVICGLATKKDGKSLPHPPRVLEFGAGAQQIQFWLDREGKYITVFDFFRQTYNTIINDPTLPVLNVGNEQNPVYLPAQMCQVLPGNAFRGTLSTQQTQNMTRFAVRKPVLNAQSIIDKGVGLLNIGQPVNATHSAFNVSLTPRLIAAPGRILESPSVYYQGKKHVATKLGSWNMQNFKFVATANLQKWTWLFIKTDGYDGPLRSRLDLETSLTEFTQALRKVGITCTNCCPGEEITIENNTVNETVDAAIHKVASKFFSSSDQKPFLLVILGSNHSDIYNRVKINCDVREGINNVCVLASNFAKRNPHTFANIALKVNLKLGGFNQSLDPTNLGMVAEGRTMFVGLDVTHPSTDSSEEAPSVVGIVSSIDQVLGQWRASVALQEGRKEMVTDLKDLLKKHLGLWKQQHNGLPHNIIVYRDGVSEGQYPVVLDEELPQLQAACREVYTQATLPRLNITIVSKRHHTRFYPTRSEDADRSTNPKPGTVVDRGVTESRVWDFFLQAHATLQGTARPIHYFVVYDEVFRRHHHQRQATSAGGTQFANAADVLEDLTHNMCYLFGRCTRSVSLCPPAYYADLVCDRARRYLHEVFEASAAGSNSSGGAGRQTGVSQSMVTIHPRVSNTMFFI
ncbi:hypothetical protein AYO21_07723 [Fonsecaea monophora]|uniref:Piwi domain-containing protein n=1 Tax=Fonsecaea monophora TaxID=254056 RepID=A0A177F332_9EURO|nr:hypothetical protein AYO21_07723 [Fonsecaea monophora]KAH0828488.1 putative RNA interference and protein silencing protein (Qde2) [Fonsecaea pedrosoi]OAG38001.1 hypothetical protein AYO21_07723 [Fonsecaea monophora]